MPSRPGDPERSAAIKPAVATERVQKVLARAGLGSRRGVEELIRQGRVEVDGHQVTLGDQVDPLVAHLSVDGEPVPIHPELRYFALNKPIGVTTTMRDRHAARSIAELMPPGPRLFPVGRLDRESEGLIVLTNDGELAHRLQHPSYGVDKEYLVELSSTIAGSQIRRLTAGVELDDGPARALSVRLVGRTGGRTAVTVVMREGRKREVRRMFDALGHTVERLIRVRLGSLELRGLAPGESRPLEPNEVTALYRVTGLTDAAPRSGRASGSGRRRGSTQGRPRVQSSTPRRERAGSRETLNRRVPRSRGAT
jgi:23S rRNA pseudouridine2605 synthase